MVSVVIPCYNGASHIVRLSKFLQGYFHEFEIIVVDDGSTDTTRTTLQGCAQVDAHVRLLELSHNQGKGAAVRAGMLAAQGEVVLFTDADLPYDLSAVVSFAKELEAGADVVLGAREDVGAVSGQQTHRTLLSKFFAQIANFVLIENVPDTQAGFKGFSKDAVRQIFPEVTIPRFGFDVEAILIAQKKHLHVVSLPVVLVNQAPSTVRVRRDGFQMCLDLVYIFWKHRLHV